MFMTRISLLIALGFCTIIINAMDDTSCTRSCVITRSKTNEKYLCDLEPGPLSSIKDVMQQETSLTDMLIKQAGNLYRNSPQDITLKNRFLTLVEARIKQRDKYYEQRFKKTNRKICWNLLLRAAQEAYHCDIISMQPIIVHNKYPEKIIQKKREIFPSKKYPSLKNKQIK
jgi:hypothetical protein